MINETWEEQIYHNSSLKKKKKTQQRQAKIKIENNIFQANQRYVDRYEDK